MKIGCRAHDYGRQSAVSLARTLWAEGYNAAQLAMPKAIEEIEDYAHIPPARLEEIRTAFAGQGVEISVLSCYMDLSTPDEAVRTAGVENIERCLQYQKIIGAKMVGSETSCQKLTAEEAVRCIPLMMDSVLRIVEEAARLDAVFAIEPVDIHPLNRPEVLRKTLDTVADPDHFRVIFDPVNVLTASNESRQDACWDEWMAVIGSHLGAMHIKDCRVAESGRRLTPLGEGVMDYTRISEWLRRDHPEVSLLRDEVILASAAADIEFIRRIRTGDLPHRAVY